MLELASEVGQSIQVSTSKPTLSNQERLEATAGEHCHCSALPVSAGGRKQHISPYAWYLVRNLKAAASPAHHGAPRGLHLTPRRYTSSPTRESLPGRLGCWTLNSISQSAPALTRRRDGVTVEAPLDCHGPIAPTGCVPRAASAAIVCHGNCQGGAPRWAKRPIVLPRLCLLLSNSLVASLNHLPLTVPQAYRMPRQNNREQESSH